MLQSSLDVLYLTIAFCILWLTFMFSMLFYYVIVVAKRAKDITDVIADKVEKIGQIIDLIKNKVEPSLSQISVLISGAKKIAEIIQEKASKRASKKRSKPSKKK